MKLTQPVFIRSFKDEFVLKNTKKCPETPTVPGTVLREGKAEDNLLDKKQTVYRSGVAKLLFLMKWSQPDILNSEQDSSGCMNAAREAHMVATQQIMQFCLCTDTLGLVLQPTQIWDGCRDFLFILRGISDADYAKQVEDHNSVSGYTVFLSDALFTPLSVCQLN